MKNNLALGIKSFTPTAKTATKAQVGTTEIKKVYDISARIKAVENTAAATTTATVIDNATQKNGEQNMKVNAPKRQAAEQTSNGINYLSFIDEALNDAGIEHDDTLVTKIYVEIIKANIDSDAPVKLNTPLEISDVTRLININLSEESQDLTLITLLINKLLNSNTDDIYSSNAEVKQFILDKANELRPTATQDNPTGQVNVDAFFNKGDGTELTVFQIYDNRYSNFGGDQTASTIESTFVSVAKERGIYLDVTEFKNFIGETITKINNATGTENTNPPILKKAALAKYLESHTLEELLALIGSNEPVNVTPTPGGTEPTTPGGTEPTTPGGTEPTTPGATEPTTFGGGTEPTTTGGVTEGTPTPTATSNVNIDGFFKGNETLTAYQIYNDKYGYLYGDDEVAKEIMTAINDVAKKLGIQVQPKEYQNLVNGIITKINEMCGVENTNPPVLSQSTLNKYFTNHSIEDLVELINSPEIENTYYQEALKALGMDDVLGDFAQNKKEGDCYFLSTLYSVSNTPNGAALLANAFGTVEIDGITHYTFTFKGGYRNKNGDESANNYCKKTTTYTFSPQEILEAVKNGYGAGGDVNAIVAEMALEALMKDQVYTNEPNTAYRNGYLANGTGVQVMHLLTGDCGANTRYTSSGSEFKNMVMNLLRNGSIQEGTTGNYMMYFGFEGHARAVVGVSEEGVTYVDPYNSSQKLFMSWDKILGNPTTYKNFQWAYIPEQN